MLLLFELPVERRLLEVDQSSLVLDAADESPAGQVGALRSRPVSTNFRDTSSTRYWPSRIGAATSTPGSTCAAIIRRQPNASAGGIG
jgi:hypothetical protein